MAAALVMPLVLMTLASPALAQRTDDNVTAESDDAFGRSVGNESLGIYNPENVRGFSPIDAGNVRIEGLYFDRQTNPTERLIEGSAIRVGIAAQSYPFPSPTGIVDYEVRSVGKQRVFSPVLMYGPFGSMGAEFDGQLPVAGEELGIAFGAGLYRDAWEWGGSNEAHSFAIVPQWRPTENVELRPFYSRVTYSDEEAQPQLLPATEVLAPEIRRNHYFGQPWAEHEGVTSTYGFLGQTRSGDWTVRLGVFRSLFAPRAEFASLYEDVLPDGSANELVVAYADSRFSSTSGELRVARTFESETRRHTVYVSARGRLQERRYGGEQEIDVGPVQLGVGRSIPKPDFTFGEQSQDEIRQRTGGLAYELRWKDVGEMSVGVQKTFYRKTSDTPLGSLPASRADPLLKNLTATFYATPRIAIYGSYAQGLEEAPVAPANAANRNAAAPALMTRQVDAGVRWALRENFKLIAGVFEVEKPYFDVDPNGIFASRGDVRHRGIELSMAGTPIKNLTVVAGARFLDAEVTGAAVDTGVIGAKPVGAITTHSIASVEYALGTTGVSLDAMAESVSRQTANTANTVQVPGRAVLRIGGRYRFTLFGKPTTARVLFSNIFDRYGWNVFGGGAYAYNAPRRFEMYLATDL